jgi:hypothetical protein
MYLQIPDGLSLLTIKLKTETKDEEQVLRFPNQPLTVEFLLKHTNYNYQTN